MIYYVLLGLSIILVVVRSSIYNSYAKSESPDLNGIFSFNAICYLGALVMFLIMGINGMPSAYTISCALFYALVVCSLQGLTVYAMKIGPMSLTLLISLYGMIIPTISGPLFWEGEYFTVLKVTGIIIMLISMWLLSNVEKGIVASKKWVPSVILIFFCSGFAGLIEKIHQSTPGRDEVTEFFVVAYFIMLIIALSGKFITKSSGNKPSIKKIVLTGLLCGVFTGIHAFADLILAGNLDSTVYFPIANGGSVILTVIVSTTIFRERCSKKNLIGIIIGLVSILMLSF